MRLPQGWCVWPRRPTGTLGGRWFHPPSAPSGLERDKFDNKTVSFEEHIKLEHNMWNYLYFIVLVRVKNKTDYTGPESYVAQMIKVWALGGVATAPITGRGGPGVRRNSSGHLLKGQEGSRGAAGASPWGLGARPAACAADGPAWALWSRQSHGKPIGPKGRTWWPWAVGA